MIHYRKMSVTDVTAGIIVHGCNCSGGFGSGVAGAIAKKWPQAKADYHYWHKSGYAKLGRLQLIWVGPGLWVANAFTQEKYGSDGKKYADLMAIQSALNEALKLAFECDADLYMPKIGCGLGGLKWEEVEPFVATIAAKAELDGINVFVCDPELKD